ncbi:hypothetical protein LTR70_009528 [Exophiala xenobiotica]|uniref:Uncharacterized protein n=1 Tax=Lithohypha guttulata TaxID=1690604 RepID=A0ABR0K250_9EURO|nr:hypothetical protein LTR24_008363 [Lithohypha guttulata]KAK5310385.1 hypothetical protein LTR70_009528 [Exophiala xenobiotica]
MSSTMDQSMQSKTIFFGVAALIAGFTVYKIWGSDLFPSSVAPSGSKSKSTGYAAPTPKKFAYTPQGDPQTWSEDDMKKFLSTVRCPRLFMPGANYSSTKLTQRQRDMAVGHHSSKHELLAMVESKLNEPTSTGFDDPREWSDEELRDYLKSKDMGVGQASRMELIAMVESKMHEPK